VKQVIVVNGALELPVGKLAVQVAHAAIAGLLAVDGPGRLAWLQAGMPKVVLRGDDAEMLERLEGEARAAGIPTDLVRDAGRTVVPAGTVTCVVLGPAPSADVDRLTRSLPLL